MKNTLNQVKFNFLVYQKGGVFIGICKETGYIEETNNEMETIHRLLNGTKVIYQAVKRNPELLPSINQRPSLKYLILFYFIPFYYSFLNIFRTYKVNAFNLSPLEFCNQV